MSAAASLRHLQVEVNGIRLHCVEAGSGPLVILLHGFPEFWYTWKRQIPALASAGFRVLAPDMRGYNLSEKPRGIASYRIGTLVDDVVGLIRHAGERRAIVVGHDWGGAVAWETAARRPDSVERLVILNAPHPAVFLRELRTLSQLRKSWYMFFFQLPWLPEVLFRSGDFQALKDILRRQPLRPGAFGEEDIRLYKEAMSQPGALTASLNYYRALRFEALSALRGFPIIEAPTMLIWGEKDGALGLGLTQGLECWVKDLRVELIGEASHWVQWDAPERVNELLLDFLSAPARTRR